MKVLNTVKEEINSDRVRSTKTKDSYQTQGITKFTKWRREYWSGENMIRI